MYVGTGTFVGGRGGEECNVTNCIMTPSTMLVWGYIAMVVTNGGMRRYAEAPGLVHAWLAKRAEVMFKALANRSTPPLNAISANFGL